MSDLRVDLRTKDGIRLAGLLRETRSETPVGSVVLAHGITVEKNEGGFYRTLAGMLSDAGFHSIRVDFRGHGESDGRPEEMTISGERLDLAETVDFLTARFHLPIGIVGTSFGAGVSVLYAAEAARSIRALALLSPVLDYEKTFLRPSTEWTRRWFNQSAIRLWEEGTPLNLEGFPLGCKLLAEFRTMKPGDRLLQLGIPTLIIHGDEDSMVPFEVADFYARKLKSGKFVAVKGADHGLAGFETKVFTEVVKWLARYVPELPS